MQILQVFLKVSFFSYNLVYVDKIYINWNFYQLSFIQFNSIYSDGIEILIFYIFYITFIILISFFNCENFPSVISNREIRK